MRDQIKTDHRKPTSPESLDFVILITYDARRIGNLCSLSSCFIIFICVKKHTWQGDTQMFQYADTDRSHILRCIQNQIFYDFHRDLVILLDKHGDLHQGSLDDILFSKKIICNLSPGALQALQEEKRRNTLLDE